MANSFFVNVLCYYLLPPPLREELPDELPELLDPPEEVPLLLTLLPPLLR
jgi:hypothetical protein